jgi:hypothetical protein
MGRRLRRLPLCLTSSHPTQMEVPGRLPVSNKKRPRPQGNLALRRGGAERAKRAGKGARSGSLVDESRKADRSDDLSTLRLTLLIGRA